MRPIHALLVLALLCACPVLVRGEEVRWLTSPNKAWATAKQEKRPLLLYFTSAGCHWCVEMKSKTFADAEVVQEVSKSFVALLVKGEDEPELAEVLEVSAYPT